LALAIHSLLPFNYFKQMQTKGFAVVLGNRGDPRPARVGRCLVVWSSGTVALALAAWPASGAAQAGWRARGGLGALAFDRALVDLAAIALLGCLAWAWLALSATVVEVLCDVRSVDDPTAGGLSALRRLRHAVRLPGGLRRLVLAGCGVVLVSGLAAPALAAGASHPRHHARGLVQLVGLPLPERAVAPPRPRRTSPSVVVRAGDSLWSIAAGGLPSDASPDEVAHRWHALYAANRGLIGTDPDLLQPGQRLRLPYREDPS
jgi:hypothetical protein